MYRILRTADQIIWGSKYRACMRDYPPTYLAARLPLLPTYLPTLPTLLDISQILNLVSRPTLSPSQHSGPSTSPSRSIASQSWTLACRPHTHDKSHLCRRPPRRCAPEPAASSKSGRPGIGQGPPGDCTPQSRAVSAPPRLHPRPGLLHVSTFCLSDTIASKPAQQHLKTTSATPIPS